MMSLAVITDKMPGVVELWLWPVLVAAVLVAPLAVIGLRSRYCWFSVLIGLASIGLACFYALGAYHQAFKEGAFSEAVWNELGGGWVFQSILSPFAGPMVVIFATIVGWQTKGRTMTHEVIVGVE